MNKKGRIKLIIIGGITFAVIFVFIYLLNIRNEFVQYLKVQYPEQSFKVGFTKVDILYDKYHASAVSLADDIHFGVFKAFNTSNIHTNYDDLKNSAQYKSKLKGIFEGSAVEKDIINVSGGSKAPYDNSGTFEQISIHLISDTDHISDAYKIIKILKDNKITAERVDFMYEKDKNVYELVLSSNDFNLTEKDLESKVRKIK
jgi:hypothetical protein